jgi:hypothetical protein
MCICELGEIASPARSTDKFWQSRATHLGKVRLLNLEAVAPLLSNYPSPYRLLRCGASDKAALAEERRSNFMQIE